MAIAPGWDSITGSHWWSNFYFWGSIVALISLGIAEVVSHRYSERKDELSAIEQEATKKAHDDEIARFHVEAARLAAEAEASRAKIAEATARAAEAERNTERERLARVTLEERLAPRRISGDDRNKMIAILSESSPMNVVVGSRLFDLESKDFADDLAFVLQKSNWFPVRYENWTMPEKGVFIATTEGTVLLSGINPLIAALDLAGIKHKTILIGGDDLRRMSPNFQPGVMYLLVGAKP